MGTPIFDRKYVEYRKRYYEEISERYKIDINEYHETIESTIKALPIAIE